MRHAGNAGRAGPACWSAWAGHVALAPDDPGGAVVRGVLLSVAGGSGLHALAAGGRPPLRQPAPVRAIPVRGICTFVMLGTMLFGRVWCGVLSEGALTEFVGRPVAAARCR